MTTAPQLLEEVVEQSPTVLLQVRVPRAWKEALAEAAKTQGLSVAALCRLILGGFLRNRLNGTGA